MIIDTNKLKELRKITDSGYLDCKKALEATNNDLNASIKWLQENGKAKAAKKVGRIAAEGLVAAFVDNNSGVILEINSETDFVAKNQKFKDLISKIGNELLKHDLSKETEINKIKIDGKTIEEIILEASSTIGEKISFRRAKQLKTSSSNEIIGFYNHFDGQKSALILIENGDKEMAKKLAMHITAMDPKFLDVNEVPKEELEKIEQEFSNSEAVLSKPEKIRHKIIEGMVNKKLSETTFTLQEFVVEPGQNVKNFMNQKNSKPLAKIRFEVGEGIQKQVVNFASEVAEQMTNKN